MNNEPLFNYGDIVRLRKDLENTDLKTGDYGVVWAVYSAYADESETILEFDYEGTFENKESGIEDLMFDKDDAERISNVEAAHFSESMKKLLHYLTNG